MKNFIDWLNEKGLDENEKRTSLSYPGMSPAATHPPLDSMTHAADAGVRLKNNHPNVIKNVQKGPKTKLPPK